METTPGGWIAARRRQLGKRREDIAGATGLSSTTIARAEQGQQSSRATFVAIGRALGLKTPELLADWAVGSISAAQFASQLELTTETTRNGWRLAEAFLAQRGLVPNNSRTEGLPRVEFVVASQGEGTPVLGEVTAGGLVESVVVENGEDVFRLPVAYPGRSRVYGLLIRGDSMAPEYRPGEYLIVEDATVERLEDGDDAVIQCDGSRDGGSTFKRVFFVGDGRVKLVALNPQYKAIECELSSIVRIGKVLGVYRPRVTLKK